MQYSIPQMEIIELEVNDILTVSKDSILTDDTVWSKPK